MPEERICLDCGHPPCEGCGTWCDIIANDRDGLKYINSNKFFNSFEADDWKEWNEDPFHDDWFPILCCEGECRYN